MKNCVHNTGNDLGHYLFQKMDAPSEERLVIE